MMNMQTRNQYLYALISQKGGYHFKSKKEKSQILDEYCQITKQHRKAVSRKIRTGTYIHTIRKETGQKKQSRSSPYDKEVVFYLIKLWEIFDRPCGKRLKTMINTELSRLIEFGELAISSKTINLLTRISARSIDNKLKLHKEKERIKRKYTSAQHPLLYEKIPVKLASDQKRGIGESIQVDLVEHCGQSAENPFICTVSVTDIGSGWWEGEPIMNRNGWSVQQALGRLQYRFPFSWKEIHTDNGGEFINQLVWRYTQRCKIDFSRSRPYRKNDNCFVEQKNSTHVRRIVGYRRYHTRVEYDILKILYTDNLRLYKNFFQPIIPLISKERIGGHIKRVYGEPKTPYKRILDDPAIEQTIKQCLTEIYQQLNPAQLKRDIKKQQDLLYEASCKKQSHITIVSQKKVEIFKKSSAPLATFLVAEPMKVRQHSLIA